MTYKVFGGTLSLTQSINQQSLKTAYSHYWFMMQKMVRAACWKP